MKVMLPVKDRLLNKFDMADGFHYIEFVCIYDDDSNSSEWILAKEISEAAGGLKTRLAENEVYSIFSSNITPMVLTMFNRSGIKVFKAQGNDITKNIGLFKNNQLKTFTLEELQPNQSCTCSSCSSCSSTCN